MSEAHTLLSPKEAKRSGEGLIGGKAWGLARLHDAGATVPEWCVLSAEACLSALDKAGLSETLRETLKGLTGLDPTQADERARLEAASQSMREAISALSLTELLGPGFADALAQLGDGPWAVRSSMVGEDSESHSFAGQLESYLFQSAEDVPHAIAKCWASAFSPHALLYRLNAGMDDLPAVAVVIQRMLNGRISGVAFTAHPVSGHRDRCLISGAWGQGEGIVSGLVDTDEYVFHHEGYEHSARIADKDIQVTPDPSGAPGTVEAPVPEPLRAERCLSLQRLGELGAELIRLERFFGAPMDIEWTVCEGTLYILQARPITSLPDPPDLDAPLIVFDNSNIQESYCGVTTPLTFSFAAGAYASVYTQTMRALGLPERTISAHAPMLKNLLGLVCGRVYYNINNWYRGLLLLPSFGTNKADMERMMGLEEPVDFVTDEALSIGERLARLPQVLSTLFRLLRSFRKLKTEVPAWLKRFETNYTAIDRDGMSELPLSGLMTTLETLDEKLLNDWHTPIINDFYVMMSVGKLRRQLSKGDIADPDDLINRLLAGEEEIESTQPVRQLMAIATLIRKSDTLKAILSACSPEEAVAKLSAHSSELRGHFERYLERYGDRCMGELKLETLTLRDDTRFIGQVLSSYVPRGDLVPEQLSQREQAMRKEAEAQMSAAMGGWAKRKAMAAITQARHAVKNREAMRLARTRMFGLYRAAYQAIGARLSRAGALKAPRDVFYLSVEEIRAYYEGRSVGAALGALANTRRDEFLAYEDVEVPNRITARAPVYLNMPTDEVEVTPADKDARVLYGIGCYPGVVEAECKVIRSPQDELDLNGQILTAVRTDPGWAPLFPTCSGILIERGSTLSHSAVVARELGIPAVVGVKHLLSIVTDGERVRIDGERGTATRVSLDEKRT